MYITCDNNEDKNNNGNKTDEPSYNNNQPNDSDIKVSDDNIHEEQDKPVEDFSYLLQDEDKKPEQTEIDEDDFVRYMNDKLNKQEQEELIKKFFPNKIKQKHDIKPNEPTLDSTEDEAPKQIEESDFLMPTAEDLQNIDTKEVIKYLKQIHNKSSYKQLQSSIQSLDSEIIQSLQNTIEDSSLRLKPLRTEAFNIDNEDHKQVFKALELSPRINRHNPSSKKTLLTKAQHSNTDCSYYVCYNEDGNIIGIFNIYNASSDIGDASSFFMAITHEYVGKGYGLSLVLSAIIQIASLNIKQLIKSNSVHTLVENENAGSMAIMQKLIKLDTDNTGPLFTQFFSRELNACKFDLTYIYNIVYQCLVKSKES